MSDFLAEMEARRQRVSRPSAPVGAVVVCFLVGFLAAVIVAAIAMESAVTLASGLARPADILAYLLRAGGGAFVVVAALGALLFAAFLRPSRPGWTLPVIGGLAAMVVVIAFGFSLLGGVGLERSRQEDVARAEIRRVMEVVESGNLDVDIGTQPKARGEPGKIERLFKEIALDFLISGRRYRDDIAVLKLENISPRELKRQGVADVIDRIRKGRARTEAYRGEIAAGFDRARTRLEKARPAGISTAAAVSEFNAGLDESAGRLERMIDVQQRIWDLNEEQLELLRRVRWEAQGETFLFYSARDAAAFNRTGAKLTAASAEFEDLRATSRERMRSIIDNP